MKKLLFLLVAVMLLTMIGTAVAGFDRTIVFEGEKSGTFVSFKKQWKDLVVINFDQKKVDRDIFQQPFDVEVEYESDNPPALFLLSYTGGPKKTQIEADTAENGVATYSYQSIQKAYGDMFSKLDSFSLRANGSDITIRKVTVVPLRSGGVTGIELNGPAGAWFNDMTAGWNLGNTMETHGSWLGNLNEPVNYETGWGNPQTTKEMIQAVADAGFTIIRIPVSWGQHLDANNTIDEAWMARVQTLVDWSLECGLKVILNIHHDTGTEGWLRADTSKMSSQGPKFMRVWQQIATRFADYDDRLALESFNEMLDSRNNWGNPGPDAIKAINQLNQMFVYTVRGCGGMNANRVLICNTYAAAHDQTCLDGFVMPVDTAEDSIIVEVHVYTPLSFCFSEKEGYKDTDWRSVSGAKSAVDAIVLRLYNRFTKQGIPVLIGEFAACAKDNEESRADWAGYLTSKAREKGMLCVWWDNGGLVENGAEGYSEMGLLDRWHMTWLYPQIVKAITGVDVNNPVNGKTWQDYEPLSEAAVSKGFKLGSCYSFSQMNDTQYLSFMARHFNSITPTNELKAYSLLNAGKTKARDDGMPGLDWTQADRMLAWAQANNVKVRGHVLVWDAYMTDWFFREDYSTGKPYADQATIRARMENYIQQVITHCEENFPGVVYCWDVVNEAVGDAVNEYEAGDRRHLRTKRNGGPNLFRELAGDDYVEYAFLCAKNTVDSLGADIGLFYNDYNTFYSDKRTAIAALVKSINSYAKNDDGTDRILCDGIGMQGYIGGYGTQSGCMNSNDVTAIRDTIRLFGNMGLQVHVTEMAIRNYSSAEADDLRHAEFTRELFDMFAGVNSGYEQPVLTCVALWGITDCNSLPSDHYTWKLNGPYCGLVTEKLGLKRAFHSVYEALLAR